MAFDFKNLQQIIETSEIITIFRHQNPDCDALGSQAALAAWLMLNFPKKRVYMVGNETSNQGHFAPMDTVSDEIIKLSCAIVLDTANTARIDDQRYAMAGCVVKIDHHPNREPFGNLCLVFEEAAATCEILAEFMHQVSDTYKVSTFVATNLYKGLLTDTLGYRTSNTTSHSLAMGAWLTGFGVDIPNLNRELFDHDLQGFRFASYLSQNVQVLQDHLAYIILRHSDLKAWDLSPKQAKNFIDTYGHVKEFQIWAIFVEGEHGIFEGSLRSKTITINDLAEQYHGGGHKNACGVKKLSENDIITLLHALANRL